MSEPTSSEQFVCPCLGILESNLKKEKGHTAYLELSQYADFRNGIKEVGMIRGIAPLKYKCEEKVQVRQSDPDAKPKFKKQWVTHHYSANFCPMCGKPVK